MDQIFREIERSFSSAIADISQAFSGTKSNSRVIRLQNGLKLFLKFQPNKDTCFSEAEGLKAINKTRTIKTPEIIRVTETYLLMEYIVPGPLDGSNHTLLGENLAKLHSHRGKQWGFDNNNYLGPTTQINTQSRDLSWSEFFLQTRIGPQIFWLRKRHLWPLAFDAYEEKLVAAVRERLSVVSRQECSLLHGDLWSGNILWDQEGVPYVIDPAVYYGHRECDLALPVLFGGFNDTFFAAYDKHLPRESGHEDRMPVYILYHLLNHVNIFGPCYLLQTQKIIEDLIQT